MAESKKGIFSFPSTKIYPYISNSKFTNKVKVVFAVVFLVLLSSCIVSIFYLNKIKTFSEYTAATYLECMELSHQLEVSTTNEESLLSKYLLSNTDSPVYIFALRQNHNELKQIINDINEHAFDNNLKENITLLKKHETELDKLLSELLDSDVSDKSRYQSVLSHYSFIRNASVEISNYSSNRYETARLNTIKLVDSSLVISSILSFLFLMILAFCFAFILKISTTLELKTIRDPLTGILNRRALDEKLRTLTLYNERSKIPFSLIMIDIDHFKNTNDTYGHQTGDKVLIDMAALLDSFIRPGDFVARYGGEEIALLLVDTGLDEAFMIAERLRNSVENHQFTTAENVPLNVTASFGVAEFSSHADLIKEADDALYRAKSGGRNRVCITGLF